VSLYVFPMFIIHWLIIFIYFIFIFIKRRDPPLCSSFRRTSPSHARMTWRWPMGQFRKPQESFLESLFSLIFNAIQLINFFLEYTPLPKFWWVLWKVLIKCNPGVPIKPWPWVCRDKGGRRGTGLMQRLARKSSYNYKIWRKSSFQKKHAFI